MENSAKTEKEENQDTKEVIETKKIKKNSKEEEMFNVVKWFWQIKGNSDKGINIGFDEKDYKWYKQAISVE